MKSSGNGLGTESRNRIITRTSILGIVVNLVIALVKIVIGTLASSVAIASEGMNNATDAFSSVMTLVGAKLAQKHPDEKHPFGYGRVEYLSSLLISGLILFAGIEMLLNAISLIFHPEAISISYLSIVIVAVSAVIKFVLGLYTIEMGQKAESNALSAVGTECRNDSFASIITIGSSLIFLFWGLSLDAYAGILISLLIIKAGAESLKETIDDILGRPGNHELALKLYREIRSTPEILAAADMILHNYGPEAWSGSVNLEIDHSRSVGEVYQELHELQLRIMHEYKVTLVFGIYAVDNDHEGSKALRRTISQFFKGKEHLKNFHAVYIDEKTRIIYCDFIVDYQQQDWDELEQQFCQYMKEKYPGYRVELTIETEFI